MNIVIVYESVYGNTRLVAEAIAAGARQSWPAATVTMARPGSADPDLISSADLLIVGGPTHTRGMTRPSSRAQAVVPPKKRAPATPWHLEPDAEGPGIREWVSGLAQTRGAATATFDTRMDIPLAGGAAPRIGRKLMHLGYTLAARPAGFLVQAGQGPLREGELERARRWGSDLAAHWAPPRTARTSEQAS